MTKRLRTFLTFQGGIASAALELYRSAFDDFKMVDIERYAGGDGGPEGSIKHAIFRLAGHELACSDSPIDHAWGFTPAVSLWVDCSDEDEQRRLFDHLAESGQIYMPLDNYGFSTRFGWVGDRYGVTWQINVP